MKINSMPGEFLFKALVRLRRTGDSDKFRSWECTHGYFHDFKELESSFDPAFWEIKWPVEVFENGTVYCPAPEELE